MARLEQHQFTGRRQVRYVALEVPLGHLLVAGRGQGHHPGVARVEKGGDALDGAALAGRVAPLEDGQYPQAGLLHVLLQLHQLDLQLLQLHLVLERLVAYPHRNLALALFLVLVVHRRPFLQLEVHGLGFLRRFRVILLFVLFSHAFSPCAQFFGSWWRPGFPGESQRLQYRADGGSW
jgi:hypothetical protein